MVEITAGINAGARYIKMLMNANLNEGLNFFTKVEIS